MPIASIETYLTRLPARMAELKLLLSDANMMPHVKENDRRNAISSWKRIVNIHSHVPVRPASDARLRLMGIGVEHVQ